MTDAERILAECEARIARSVMLARIGFRVGATLGVATVVGASVLIVYAVVSFWRQWF